MKNETKHTPGPWQAGASLITNLQSLPVALVLHGTGPGEKHKPRDYDRHATTDLKVHAANGDLISAAPELLEALKELREYFEDDNPGGVAGDSHLALLNEKALAAIAKAEGGL